MTIALGMIAPLATKILDAILILVALAVGCYRVFVADPRRPVEPEDDEPIEDLLDGGDER